MTELVFTALKWQNNVNEKSAGLVCGLVGIHVTQYPNAAVTFQPQAIQPRINPSVLVHPTSSVLRKGNRTSGSCFCMDDSGICATAFPIPSVPK